MEQFAASPTTPQYGGLHPVTSDPAFLSPFVIFPQSATGGRMSHQKNPSTSYYIYSSRYHHRAFPNNAQGRVKNIGLVKYALSHGQPINSVLDGVLPLHAASSGGSDLVGKLLIEQGADVNASR